MKPKRPDINLRSLGRVVGVLFKTFPIQDVLHHLVLLLGIQSDRVDMVRPAERSDEREGCL